MKTLAQLFDDGARREGYDGTSDLTKLASGPLLEQLRDGYRRLSFGPLHATDAAQTGYYFDYLNDESVNAMAFLVELSPVRFIGVTHGAAIELARFATLMSRDDALRSALGVPQEKANGLAEVLLQLSFTFIVSHEWAHHELDHVGRSLSLSEIRDTYENPNWNQIIEVDADGFAGYRVVSHLLTGPMRAAIVADLELTGLTPEKETEVLLLSVIM